MTRHPPHPLKAVEAPHENLVQSCVMASAEGSPRDAVVLIGHGAPAIDCPRQLVGELMSLEWRQRNVDDGARFESRIAELDATIRNWPRRADNDPYKAGLEQVAEALRPMLPAARLSVAYNEFCRPSIAEAIADVVRWGATRVFLIPSMLTPGGLHAERDIPEALEAARRAHPDVAIRYLWPFDTTQVAALLAAHLRPAMRDEASAAKPLR